MNWVKSGYKIPLYTSSFLQTNIPLNNNFNKSEKLVINNCIKELLYSGAINICDPIEGQYLSSIFLVPKPDGTSRFILNVKSFKRYVITNHFKMEDIRTAIKLR